MAKTPPGYVIYEGPSQLDPNTNIVAIVNCIDHRSDNEKTGAMAQSFILRTDMKPNEAVRQGLDHAICGRCPYAGGKGCYVGIKMVCSVYGAFKRGSYVKATPVEVATLVTARVKAKWLHGLRFGSYGDPAAVPFEVWQPLMDGVRAVGGRTSGYTHQWSDQYAYMGRTADPRFRTLAMASTHNLADARRAEQDGWRAFTVFDDEADLRNAGMAMCPASKEAGYRKTCGTCGSQSACNGRKSEGDRRVSIGIVVHGTEVTKARARAATAALKDS